MQSIGEALKKARESKGLSLQQVEDETNMRWKYLEALEEENFSVIPGKAYIKGFLRNYAAFLGLDCDAIINQYRQVYEVSAEAKERIGENEVRKRKSPSNNKHLKWPRVVLAGFVALGIVYFAIALTTKEEGIPQPPTTTQGSEDQEKQQKSAQPEQQSDQQQADINPETPPPKTEVPPQEQPPANSADDVSGASSVEANNTGEFEIKLQASGGKSWLRVVVDGERVYQGFIDNDQTQTYKAKSKVAIRLGNAGVVSVLTNGQNVGKLGEIGQVVNWEFSK